MSLFDRQPKISIVTPSLNQGRFLQQCIDSVRSQNWEQVEHFIIDGGSTDETLRIIEDNANRITAYVSESDNGAADAINKGFAKCSGDIVAWLNADDFYLPGAFQKIAEAWQKNPDASFWFGNGARTNEAGKTTATFNPRTVVYNHNALINGLDYILQPSTFINPRALKQVHYLNAELRWGFDWDLWIRLANVGQPVAIQDILAASREWGETLTASGGFKRTEELRKIAELHSGTALTPGAACYWLDTLSKAMKLPSSSFGDDTIKALHELWRNVQLDMRRLDVDSHGMPTRADAAIDSPHVGYFDGATERLIIAVDLYPLRPGISGGIVPWVKGVLRAMARRYPSDRIIMFHRPGLSPIQIEDANVTYIELPEHQASFYEAMTGRCRSIGVQVMIRTYPQETHPDFAPERQIFVIPDLQHEYFSEFFTPDILAKRRRAFTQAFSLGGAVATMTEHSRSTIAEKYGNSCDDIFLMPAALPEEFLLEPTSADLPEKAKAFAHYFYMPGNLWPHKNHRRLLQAFKKALPNLPSNTGLVLTGSPEGAKELTAEFPDLPVAHLGFLPEIQVAALYKNATALVYFSLFEGFGMPVLEALRYGVPVLCSNTTSLPEVGGDAVLSCDPTDIDAMAGLMCSAFQQPSPIADFATKAASRLAAYNWDAPAEALHEALKRRLRAKPQTAKEPFISIVMPTRNQGHFIRESINSVLNQDYPNSELVVMDGASTDDTVDILKSYGEKIRWISEPDKGQADAINKGMNLVQGDILAYLNSDDILLPGALNKVAKQFMAHPEYDMIYGNADYIDKDGLIIGSYNSAEFSFPRLMQDCCVCQPAAFWRRRAAVLIGPFNANLQTTMDYEYWLRMASQGANIQHVQDKLAQSRLHEDAKTLAMRGKIFKEIFQICKANGGYVSFSYYCGLWSYKLYETWSGGEKLRKVFPRLYQAPALLDFSTQVFELRRDRASRRYVARTVFDIIDQRVPAVSTMIRKAWRISPRLRRIFS